MARAFDHFLILTQIGRGRKLRRNFTVAERWCYVAGVLAIAADAPIRGRLLIEGEPADAHDVAEQAGVSVAVAQSTLKKLRAHEMLVPDEELTCERVHDFEHHNPEPKRDKTGAERARRYRAKLAREEAESNATVTRDVTRDAPSRHAPEEKGREGEEKNPPAPFQGEREGGDLLGLVKAKLQQSMAEHTFAGWVEPVEAQSFDGSTLVVVAGERSSWVRERFAPLLADTATEVHGSPVEVVVAETDAERTDRIRLEASELRKDRRAQRAVAEAQTGGAST